MSCTKRCSCGIVGVILIILGCLLEIFWLDIIMSLVGQEMALSPTSATYEDWRSPSLPLYFDIYFFNWTNPQDFRNNGTKPVLEELGPYRFREIPEKVNINWHSENSSVSYQKKSLYFFDKSGSNGSLIDEITVPNMLALGSAGKSQLMNSFKRFFLSRTLNFYNQGISVTKSADELLFTGYEDKMLTDNKHNPFASENERPPYDKVGFFYQRNGSETIQGSFNVNTGVKKREKIGQMNSWNYLSKPYCEYINGSSAGEFFPPNLNTSDIIKLFTPEMCGSLKLDYVGTVEIHGIEGYKFSAGLRSVDNGSVYNETKCFCSSECYPSGVINLSKCKYDAPVFVSYPHYLHGDSFYSNQVEGISADQNKHEFYIVLEPRTGSIMEVAARIQLNVLLDEYKGLSLFEGVKKTFIPVIWFEQKVTITSEIASDLKIVPYLITIGLILSGIMVLTGIVIISWTIVFLIMIRARIIKIEKIKAYNNELYPKLSPLLNKKKINN